MVTATGPTGPTRPLLPPSRLTCPLQGPRLTLLVPRDQHRVLGYDTLTLPLRRSQPLVSTTGGGGNGSACLTAPARRGAIGVTVRDLLTAVHQYYQEELSAGEVAEAMASHPALRRKLQVAWQTLSAVCRWELLGSSLALYALRRCSHDDSLAVYELYLLG
jgi:hypothetical protein